MNLLKTLAISASIIAFGATANEENNENVKQALVNYATQSIELDITQVNEELKANTQVKPVKLILVETFDVFEQESALEIALDNNLEQIQY